MDLTGLHEELGRCLELDEENLNLKRELKEEKAMRADFERRCKTAERDLKKLRTKDKSHLTYDLESQLLQRSAVIRYEATQRGKFKVSLRLGRQSTNILTEMIFDPEDKKARPLREVVEKALAAGR